MERKEGRLSQLALLLSCRKSISAMVYIHSTKVGRQLETLPNWALYSDGTRIKHDRQRYTSDSHRGCWIIISRSLFIIYYLSFLIYDILFIYLLFIIYHLLGDILSSLYYQAHTLENETPKQTVNQDGMVISGFVSRWITESARPYEPTVCDSTSRLVNLQVGI